MTTVQLDRPPPRPDRRHSTAVRDLLARSGYTRDGVQDVLGASGDVLSTPLDRPLHIRRLELRPMGTLETLIRLFLLDEPVDRAVAERTIGPTLDALEELAMVAADRTDTGRIRGLVRIVTHGGVTLASDLPDPDGARPDHVAGLQRPSLTLSDLTVRRPVRTALDVGTGCGIQALLAARHAEHVIATDINERALAFAALNAALNGIDNIEFRPGSFFDPVAGETFGLVVCNPPYVISPETAYLFRDSGLGRDRVSERLVGQLPDVLDEGAFGTIMASWIQDGDDPAARPGAWLARSGCDAWILHTEIEDPLATAATWNRELAPDPVRFGEAIDRWLAYFRDEGIEALAYGALVIRKRSAEANWIRSRELPNQARDRPADHVLRLFTGPDASAGWPGAILEAQRLVLADGTIIDTRLRHGPEGWTENTTLQRAEGIPFVVGMDRTTADFLGQLDGSRSLGEVLDAFARAHDGSPDRVRESGAKIARELLELGLLVPSPARDSLENR